MAQFALTQSIKKQTEIIFYNMEIAMKTCNWSEKICGTDAWRYIYHTLHSCDRWFINPEHFIEPSIHTPLLDKVDIKTDSYLSKEELWDYFEQVKHKTLDYLEHLSDEELYEKPKDCSRTKVELILGQYRHFMCHIGILNGVTIATTNKYPMVVGLEGARDGKLFDEG